MNRGKPQSPVGCSSFLSSLNKFLVYLNLFFLQSYLIRFFLGAYPTNLQEVFIILNAAVFFVYLLCSKNFLSILRNLRHHYPILILFTLTLVSVLTVGWIDQVEFLRYLKFLFFAAVLVVIALETFKTSAERKNLVKVAGLGALSFGLFSLIWNATGHDLVYDYRLTGPLDSAVYLAFYLSPFFIFFVLDWLKNKEWKNLIYVILLFLLILATRSLGAIAASFGVLSLFFLKQSNILKNKTLRIGLLLSGILILFLLFYVKILPAIQSDSSSLGERFQIWQTAFYLLKNPYHFIFGLGFGQFETHYIANVAQVLGHEPLDYYILQPHNIFLLFWFHFGLAGLVFLIYWMIQSAKKVIFFTGKNLFAQFPVFMLFYFFFHGMIDTPFFKNDLLILFLLFLEMTFLKDSFSDSDSKTENSIQ